MHQSLWERLEDDLVRPVWETGQASERPVRPVWDQSQHRSIFIVLPSLNIKSGVHRIILFISDYLGNMLERQQPFIPSSIFTNKKNLYVIYRKRPRMGFLWVGPTSKKLQAQNFDIKPAFFRMSSFFHLSTVASLADGRLRCGNQQKFLWCRNTGKRLCRCCSHWIPGREAWAWGAIAKSLKKR